MWKRCCGDGSRWMLVLLLLCGMAVSLAGCAGKGTPTASYVTSAPAVRLSPAEQAAFDSTGQLDRGLSQKGKNAVLREYTRYLRQNRSSSNVIVRRSEKYLAQTREIFRRYGLPEELAYLAIVESGYNPEAVSRSGAAGAWQFMPGTGKHYGLAKDDWLDERMDPYKSADAAARYLKRLYQHFGNWYLAVAAYNAGEGKVARARDRAGCRDFFELVERNHRLSAGVRLKDETLAYVPRLLAVVKIMRNLDTLGFAPIYPEREERMVPLRVQPGTDLMALAKASNMPWAKFRAGNTAHRHQITSAYQTTVVYVPESRRALAQAHLRTASPTRYRLYTVKSGDTWRSISRQGGVEVPALLAVNQGVRLKTGIRLVVPDGNIAGQTRLAEQKRPAAGRLVSDAAEATVRQATHIVQAGDSMWSIARRYKVKPQDLMRWNNTDGGNLQPGDRVVIRM
ncbi:MAG: transglycosylase SLT domain-containing protein [Desulfovibrionaceae bacterium]